MEWWEIILGSGLGAGIIATVLAKFFDWRLNKQQSALSEELEDYKNDLSRQLEGYKADLARDLEVHKSRLQREQMLFEKRLESYRKLYQLRATFHDWATLLGSMSIDNVDENVRSFYKMLDDFVNSLRTYKIEHGWFTPSAVLALIDSFIADYDREALERDKSELLEILDTLRAKEQDITAAYHFMHDYVSYSDFYKQVNKAEESARRSIRETQLLKHLDHLSESMTQE